MEEQRSSLRAKRPPLSGSGWVTVEIRVPSALGAESGNGQAGPVGAPLPAPVAVRVTDQGGDPVVGVEVAWMVGGGPAQSSSGDGSGPASSPGGAGEPVTVTDENGIAQTTWTLGTAVGQQTLLAAVDTLSPLGFVAEAQPGAVATVSVTPSTFRVGNR